MVWPLSNFLTQSYATTYTCNTFQAFPTFVHFVYSTGHCSLYQFGLEKDSFLRKLRCWSPLRSFPYLLRQQQAISVTIYYNVQVYKTRCNQYPTYSVSPLQCSLIFVTPVLSKAWHTVDIYLIRVCQTMNADRQLGSIV